MEALHLSAASSAVARVTNCCEDVSSSASASACDSRGLSASAVHSLQSISGRGLGWRQGGKNAGDRYKGCASSIRCRGASDKVGFFGKLGKVIKEKAKSDIERLFSGFTKTRENLSVIDELLTYWNLEETESTLDELEEALLVADFGPRTALKIVDTIRKDILAGRLKTGAEIRAALKRNIVALLTAKAGSSELQLGERRPAVVMIVGVNGGGKTTSIGKLAHRLKKGDENLKILLAAGDTFRAAASEQLEVWAKRSDCEIVIGEGVKPRPASVLSEAVKRAAAENFDIVLADTSGRLHTNYNLMEELRACKRAVAKALPGAPNEVLLVLDGTTGLNMLPQAREFNQVVGVTGFVLTKMDGTSRGGCVVSVVDELSIPVKFVGVGEGMDDLQPFDPQGFVDALFP